MMIRVVASLACAAALVAGAPVAVQAKGCLRGAAAGAVVGHYAGHHAVVGAVGGCIAARHYYKQKARQQAEAAHPHR